MRYDEVKFNDGEDEEQPIMKDNMHPYVDLFAFADRYDIVALRNNICDVVLSHYAKSRPGTFPTNEEIAYLWTRVHKQSGLSRLVVELVAWSWQVSEADLNKGESAGLPPDMILPLFIARATTGHRRPAVGNRCRYHEHKDGIKAACEGGAYREWSKTALTDQ